MKAERNSLNRKLQSAQRGVRSSFRGLLSAGEKAQAASDNLLDVQMQRRLAQESNASLREQTRLRNLETGTQEDLSQRMTALTPPLSNLRFHVIALRSSINRRLCSIPVI